MGTANGYCKLYDGYCEQVLNCTTGTVNRSLLPSLPLPSSLPQPEYPFAVPVVQFSREGGRVGGQVLRTGSDRPTLSNKILLDSTLHCFKEYSRSHLRTGTELVTIKYRSGKSNGNVDGMSRRRPAADGGIACVK